MVRDQELKLEDVRPRTGRVFCESSGEYIKRGVGVVRDQTLKLEEVKASHTLR